MRRGFVDVLLRSNVVRLDTHVFYKGIGYALAATSHLFSKSLR